MNTNITNIHNLIKDNNSSKKFGNKLTQFLIPFINNGIQIIPAKYTKEVLNSSYKIINKYKGNKFNIISSNNTNMKNLLDIIENNNNLPGKKYWEIIILSINKE